MRKVITTYVGPDMDGIALMYAYKEFLNKKGEEAEFYYEGEMKKEAQIVLDMFGIEFNSISKIEDDDKIVLVDTNDFPEISKCIKRENVVQIIDHHRNAGYFDDIKDIEIQIEFIGAASTLVAERFKNENIEISRESAILLYMGIISNTMNLKIKMTSDRDREMAKWLKDKNSEITDEAVTEVFVKKTEIGSRLREEMEVELKDPFVTISWTMGQLEVAYVEDFLNKYESRIREIMDTVSKENDVEYISVNCMDVINGYSIIVAGNEGTAKIIGDAIGVSFNNLKAKTEGLASRKEIVKVIRDIYKKQ